MTHNLLIIYFSKEGSTEKMAHEIGRGAKDSGANIKIRSVINCYMTDLLGADAIAFGSPTYYCNIAWQSKKFLDEALFDFYAKGFSLRGKVCGCFTSSGGYDDGRQCLWMMELTFAYPLKMVMVPGVILESKDVVDGNVLKCYDLGQRLVAALADIR